MKMVARIALSLLVLCTMTALAHAGETITIPGSGSSQVILRDVAAAFMKANPGIKIEVPDSSGTGGGYKAAGEGTTVFGRVSRKANEKEAGYNLTYRLFGKTPIVVTTHPGVTLKALTWAQTRDLFTGKIVNWKEVGGPDLKVRVIARHPTENNFMSLKTAVPEWKDLVVTERSKLANTDPETVQFILENEGAVGFISVPDAKEKGLGLPLTGGVKYSDAAYPVFVEMALVYKPEKFTGAAKAFADYLFTPEAQGIIKANGAIPVAR